MEENKPLHKMTKEQLLELIQNEVNGIQKQHDSTQDMLVQIQENQNSINKFTNEIKDHHENINTIASEIQNQHTTVDELTNKIQEQYETNEQVFEEKNKQLDQLTKQIESLLPGATSAGLGSSYNEARKERSTTGYWWGFVISLLILTGGYFTYFTWFSQEFHIMHFITRTFVGMPLLWIAWYCQVSISQINRIKEEYHHKQRIMSVFNGFSKEIDDLTKDNPEQNKQKKLELITVIINAIQKNPSEKINPSSTFLGSIKSTVSKDNQKVQNGS